MNKNLTFKDISLVPANFTTISSRSDVDTSVKIGNTTLQVPIIASNMDSVYSPQLSAAVIKQGGIATVHRFCTIDQNIVLFKEGIYNNVKPWVSVGVGTAEIERAEALVHAGAETLVIDVANGAQEKVLNQFKALKMLFDVDIIVGNFDNSGQINTFVEKSGKIPTAWKIGVGPGCFAAGTRVLMSNATYKNIEDVKVGDFVINKNGQSVKVIGTKNSGFRSVVKYKNNNFYKETIVTPDHRHWIGDYSTIKNINDVGLGNVLDKSTKSGDSKYKWQRIDQTQKSTLLMPKNIKFDLKENFLINLKEFSIRSKSFEAQEYNNEIKSSYNLGYIFGTFLGDGHSRVNIHKNSVRGKVSWYFNKTETYIVYKLTTALKEVSLS